MLALFLGQPTSAEPYNWPLDAPACIVAPTDTRSDTLDGAALQGGLIDLRYGQASIDSNGSGVILEWNDSTLFTLNGSQSSAKELAELVVSGQALSVTTRYNPESGVMGWLDAFTPHEFPAIKVSLKSREQNEDQDITELSITLGQNEAERLNFKNPHLFIPGVTHSLPLETTGKRWSANLPLMNGWEWRNLPIFVVSDSSRVFRASEFTVSSKEPVILGSGPRNASAHLKSIPCWIDLEQPTYLLDYRSFRLSASGGARIRDLQLRSGRLSFHLEVEEPGIYKIEAKIGDKLDRWTSIAWSITVQP